MDDEITIINTKESKRFSIIKIIKEEVQDAQIHKETLSNAPTYEYDILYENQRGLFLFGLPKFSSNALNQADPQPWSDKNQKFSPMDIYTYQLPNPTWEWVHKEWLVDMSGDVDEEGWEYAPDFHFPCWHGCYQPFRSFVRRRRWVRLRRQK
ncbi:5617_t:CDS:2 [Cetraspora pellucida]|uniref:5617_t:CDS:1 n=1 Tax=Cetraspora pellucida TaxID=1433469 RepID=A0ACA9LG87_9GLOM|nr:5617_t:CDS:2 [Cetraspora pellucida]